MSSTLKRDSGPLRSRSEYSKGRESLPRLESERFERESRGIYREWLELEKGRRARFREEKEKEAARRVWERFCVFLDTTEDPEYRVAVSKETQMHEGPSAPVESQPKGEIRDPNSPVVSQPKGETRDLSKLLSGKLVGQTEATRAIVPYVYMYQSGLAPEGRPAGVFLLLGPTGTGKTKTVEAIAELLHGSEKKLLKIDCGEFQMDHETAKLVGAPPGYLGHRETVPLLTQQQLTDATSENCDLALVLFDEIEKAAPSITSLLLGILDKGILRLGDNSAVNFEKSLIFFTSNLGARQMLKELNPEIGFQSALPRTVSDVAGKLESIALGAVRKRFSPEFVNRIDAVVTYHPLDADAMEMILDRDIEALQTHVKSRLSDRCFGIKLLPESRAFLLRKGVSQQYGARELKRTLHRELTQPLATMVARREIPPGANVLVSMSADGEKLLIQTTNSERTTKRTQVILIVDDNHDLLLFLASDLRNEGWEAYAAESAAEARTLFRKVKPNVLLLDYLLGEEDGLKLGIEFQAQAPDAQIVIMTGGGLSEEEQAVCRQYAFPVLYKPFLMQDVVKVLQGRQQPVVAGRPRTERDKQLERAAIPF